MVILEALTMHYILACYSSSWCIYLKRYPPPTPMRCILGVVSTFRACLISRIEKNIGTKKILFDVDTRKAKYFEKDL
jgi:hypothetical protein